MPISLFCHKILDNKILLFIFTFLVWSFLFVIISPLKMDNMGFK